MRNVDVAIETICGSLLRGTATVDVEACSTPMGETEYENFNEVEINTYTPLSGESIDLDSREDWQEFANVLADDLIRTNGIEPYIVS